MPFYVYKCANEHMESVYHPMLYSTGRTCIACDTSMWRVPQAINVTWGGLSPSQGEYSPELKAHFETLDQQRDKFEAEHEAHERRTENENA